MGVSLADVDWLSRELRESSAASVKLFYLSHFGIVGDATAAPVHRTGDADPMGLARHECWTLRLLLWAARLISCDERTLWECLAPSFTAHFNAPVHTWNDQQAVKVVHRFLERDGDFDALRQELANYVTASIKPVGAHHVARGGGDGEAGTLCNLPGSGGGGAVRVVPMKANDVLSEGSLVCDDAVPAFGELLRVPRNLMFYAGSVVEHCSLGRVIAKDARLSSILENEEALLVLCFIYEFFLVGPAQSHWAELLRRCPPAYPTVPAFMNLSMLTELSGVDMVDEVIARRAQTTAVYEAVRAAFPLLLEGLCAAAVGGETVPDAATFEAAFTVDNMMFATATFDSRAFNLHVDGEDVLSLVPLADMINHQNRSDVLVRRVEDDGGDFVMQVGAALGAGDVGRELWMSYGPLQNWELLQYYGFVLENNEYDQLPFPFAAEAMGVDDAGEAWAARRAALVERYALYSAGRCWIGRDGVPCEALRALMRVYLAPAEEFARMEEGDHGPFTTLSASLEDAVKATIVATVDAALEQFPTTLEEDRELLADLRAEAATAEDEGDDEADAHAAVCLQLCLRVRMGIKEIAERVHVWAAS